MGRVRRQNRRFLAEWLILGVALLVAAAALTVMLLRERSAIESAEADRLRTQARVVDENLSLQMEGANKALLGIAAELAEGGDRIVPEPALTPKLKLLSDAMAGVSSMFVLDSGGTIVAASIDTLIGKNFKQRDYFDAPRRGPSRTMLYVSPPFHTTTNGKYVVVVSRALTDAHGEFSGVVAATLDTDYFTVVLRSVLYAPDMRATLVHRDGKVFLSMPATPTAGDPDPAFSTAALGRHLESGSANSLKIGTDGADGKSGTGAGARMVAMRTLERSELRIDKAMVVAVSRPLAAVYLPWWVRARQSAATYGVFVLGAGLALSLHHRRRRTGDDAAQAIERERRTGTERVELALRGADLGLWDLHVPSGDFVVNARERALLGFAEGDTLPQGGRWRELIHPDDRAHVDGAILPHLRGEAAAYECEHRMRHTDGHDVWLSTRAMIVERATDGSPIRIVGTHLDISERKRAEERLSLATAMLRHSEEELRLVTDNMPALVSRLDADQRFRFANRAYQDWLGIDPATLLGRSLVEVYGDELYRAFGPRVERAMAGARVVYEREMQTRHGPKWVEVTLVPHAGDDGTATSIYALINDITARHEAETRLAMSEERLSLALESSGLALFDWNIAAGTLYHSAQAAAMCGNPPEEVTAPTAELQAFINPVDLPGMLAQMKAAVTGAVPVYLAEYRLRRGVDDWLWIRARGRVVQRDAAGRALRLAGTYTDIHDAKIAEGRLRRLAEFDTLTGLPNRALFTDRLRQGMARAARGKPMALLFLDIDRFKSINDTYGHEAGDKLLRIFAGRMQGVVRQSDTVARLAGDEFTIILEQLGGPGDARTIARKLVEALRQPVAIAGRVLEVTASIGVAMCAPGASDDVALLRRADEALYEAKRRGRDRFHCAESESDFVSGAAGSSVAVH
jgi:diguanylate cyclase (GGDEF)-like protein/PAS domain S-box-containing protein